MKAYTNPIITYTSGGNTADPYVLRYNGYYYHCYNCKDGICIAKAEELCDIGKGEVVVAFPTGTDGLTSFYAPELHRINGSFYIYAAPDCGGGMHSMTVFELKGDNPMGTYTNLGTVRGLENQWTIDGTVFEHDGKLWFSWTNCKMMYLAQMENPYTLKGDILELAHPEYPYETKVSLVNEGPAVLKRGNKIHIVFSANDSQSDDYCLGILTYCGGDILDIKNWEKTKEAVFQKTEDIFGPGHCSFTTVTENGEEKDYIVYHANLESGSGWYGRHVWIQEFTWDENDYPVFGKPHR